MILEEAREARRNLYVEENAGNKETFTIASAEASPFAGRLLSQPTECRRRVVETFVCRAAHTVLESSRNRVARSA